MITAWLKSKTQKWGRSLRSRQTRTRNQHAYFEFIEARMLMSSVLANWTMDSIQNVKGTNSGDYAANSGQYASTSNASAVHANNKTTFQSYSGVSGGSFGADYWSVGDYYQFTTSTLGYSGLKLTFSQRVSGTGPRDFNVLYSTDGVNFQSVGSYALTTTNFTDETFTFSTTAVDNQALVYIRLVDASTTSSGGGTVGTGGTSRLDNVNIEADTVLNQNVGFDKNAYEVSEDGQSITINVNRVGVNGTDLSGTLTVNYATADGTAVSGTNYTGVSGTLTFEAGQSIASITIPITALHPQGGDKAFTLTLSNAALDTGALVTLTNSLATITVKDSTQTISLVTDNLTVNDNGGTAYFSFKRDGYTGDATTVNYTISGDITASGAASFTAGSAIGTISINIPNVSGNKSFTITITSVSGSGSVLGTLLVGNGKIIDADAISSDLSGSSTTKGYTTSINPSGTFDSTYFAVSGDGTAAGFKNPSYQVLEFSKSLTPSLYPASWSHVDDINSLSLTLYNTKTDGDYGGHVGNFNIYLLTDSTASNKLKYNTSVSSGLSAQSILLGTLSFNNTLGYSTYSLDSLSDEAKTLILSALNGGTSFRLVVTPSETGVGAMAADWQGTYSATQAPALSLDVDQTTVYKPEYINVGSASYSVDRITANTIQITVTRTGDDINDAASINFATVDGSAIAGTDYTATSGTLNFAAGQSTATFTIDIAKNAAVYGSKKFKVVLSSPDDATANGYMHVLGSQSTAVVNILDSRTVDVSQRAVESVSVTSTKVENSNDRTNSLGYFKVEPAGTYASYSVTDFNTIASSGGDGAYFNLPQGYTIGNINSVTLSLINYNQTWLADGTINVYVASDNYYSIDPATSDLRFSADDAQGVNGKLGNLYLLGTINYSKSQSTTDYTDFTFTAINDQAEALLINSLTGTSPIRLVMASADGQAAASFYGNNPDYAPRLSFNLSPVQTAPQLPSYITASEGAQYTWNESTGQLSLTSGTLTFADDAANHNASINLSVDGANSSVIFNTTQHLTGLTLTNGAKAKVLAGINSVLVVNASNFMVDSSSVLDLTNNSMILKNGGSLGLSTVQSLIASGSNGFAWNGSGISSSTIAANDPFANALGYVLAGDMESIGLPLPSIGSETIGSNDVIIKHTTQGDANLDGVTNVDDYSFVDNNLDSSGTSWLFGDFDYNGQTNVDDYSFIDNNLIG